MKNTAITVSYGYNYLPANGLKYISCSYNLISAQYFYLLVWLYCGSWERKEAGLKCVCNVWRRVALSNAWRIIAKYCG